MNKLLYLHTCFTEIDPYKINILTIFNAEKYLILYVQLFVFKMFFSWIIFFFLGRSVFFFFKNKNKNDNLFISQYSMTPTIWSVISVRPMMCALSVILHLFKFSSVLSTCVTQTVKSFSYFSRKVMSGWYATGCERIPFRSLLKNLTMVSMNIEGLTPEKEMNYKLKTYFGNYLLINQSTVRWNQSEQTFFNHFQQLERKKKEERKNDKNVSFIRIYKCEICVHILVGMFT